MSEATRSTSASGAISAVTNSCGVSALKSAPGRWMRLSEYQTSASGSTSMMPTISNVAVGGPSRPRGTSGSWPSTAALKTWPTSSPASAAVSVDTAISTRAGGRGSPGGGPNSNTGSGSCSPVAAGQRPSTRRAASSMPDWCRSVMNVWYLGISASENRGDVTTTSCDAISPSIVSPKRPRRIWPVPSTMLSTSVPDRFRSCCSSMFRTAVEASATASRMPASATWLYRRGPVAARKLVTPTRATIRRRAPRSARQRRRRNAAAHTRRTA